VCGDFAVGKTSLRRKFMGETFTNQYLQTLGVDISTKTIDFENGWSLRLQIWDFSGQPAFQIIRKRFLLGVAGVLYIFDLTRKETLLNLLYWVDEIRTNVNQTDIPVILIGNKVDLKEFPVHQNDVNQFIETLDHGRF
jgi:small GTP-binding protein